MAQHSIVFELRGASESVKQLLLTSTLFNVLHAEVERGQFNRALSLFVAFEDAQRLVDLSNGLASVDVAPLDELAGVIRGTGKGLGVVVQTMQGFSRRLLPNLATKIIGRLGSASDYAALGADLALDSDQIEWARKNLKPGTFIAQVAEGDWREPFEFHVPLVRTQRVVDDAEAADSRRALDAIPTVPADEFTRWEPRHLITIHERPERRAQHSPPTAQSPGALSEAEIRFLQSVVEKPGQKSSEYAALAGMSGARAVKIRTRLVQLGLIREQEVATGSRGRNAIVLEPTDAGRDAAAKED